MAGKGLKRGSAGTEIVKNFVVRSELLAEPQERQASSSRPELLERAMNDNSTGL